MREPTTTIVARRGRPFRLGHQGKLFCSFPPILQETNVTFLGGCALSNKIAEKTTLYSTYSPRFFLPAAISRELPQRFRQTVWESQCRVWLYHLNSFRNFGPEGIRVMTCLIEFLDTVSTCSQGWQTLAVMLIKRRNFNRNYLPTLPSDFVQISQYKCVVIVLHK